MATYLQCFWGLSLSLSLYFIQSTPTPQVTLLPKSVSSASFVPFSNNDLISLFISDFFDFSQVYIVYLGLSHIHDPTLTSKYHHQLLSNVFARFCYIFLILFVNLLEFVMLYY